MGGRLRGGCPGRRAPLLRAGLLVPRQRLLRRVGRHQQGQGDVQPVARRARLPGRPWRPRGAQSGAARGSSAMTAGYSADEMMAVTASRALRDGMTCFVGIGLPSEAANLAKATHAPNLVLIYESGTIGAKPGALPLSIGDGILAETADTVVSVPEIFNYWLQPGRIDVGFLGAAQLDRYANINTTVVGPYVKPKVRLPGAGGAPEISSSAREVLIIVKHSKRTLVNKVDFVTSVGFLT